MKQRPYILWLDDPAAVKNPLLGGKFSSLAESTAAGLPVPPGFGITTHAYRDFMAYADLEREAVRVRAACAELRPEDIGAKTAPLIEAIRSAPLPAPVEHAVREAYALLEEKAAKPGVPVAVRSSGESEDLAGASFAGQYETFLWITGPDALIEHMRRCWAGMFGDAVLSYRHEGVSVVSNGDFGICVGIQRMVDARAAGVMFTLDPITGDRSKVSIEACWGLGEGVVKGELTPSQFLIDKVVMRIVKRNIVDQTEEYRFDAAFGGVERFAIPQDRQSEPCLSDSQVLRLVRLAKDIERDRGGAQDIEWAVDENGVIAVLQVRPETVWSNKVVQPTLSVTSPVAHVLSRMTGSTATPKN